MKISLVFQYIEPVVGPVKDIDTGKVIFEHKGIHHYTIGKRITMVPDHCQSAVGLFAAGLDDKTQTVWVVRLYLKFIFMDCLKTRVGKDTQQ